MDVARWIPWLFLAVSLVGAWFTANAFRPVAPGSRRAVVSFFAGWLTSELALHHLAWQALFTLLFVGAGALRGWPGWVGLGITLLSWMGLVRCWRGARSAEAVVEQALTEGLGAEYRATILPAVAEHFAPRIDWRPIMLPFPMRHPEVERVRDVEYGRHGNHSLRLDVYRHRDCPAGAPTLLQIHGGAWVVGSKNEQGIPLMLHLAARGWVCVAANYRLSPRATFPDHLVDVKRAIAWIRAHGAEYGSNPDFVAVTGGSAGGHLAALAALTANDPEYQPGFEAVDTALRACVAFYGVYDFTDRHELWRRPGLRRLLERHVMKAPFESARDAFDRASPMSRVRADAPPFLIVHGDCDSLVPVEEARRFARMLRAVSESPVVYAEIPGAQHAFELFPSLRSTFVIHGVERFLAAVYSGYLAAGGTAATPPAARRA